MAVDRDFNTLYVNTTARPTVISLGSAGWGDNVIANFDAMMNGFKYTGLVGAALGTILTSSSPQITLFSLSSLQMYVWVEHVLIFRRGTTPTGASTLKFGSNATAYDNWNDGVLITALDNDDHPLLVMPCVNGGSYSNTAADAVGMVNSEDSPLSPEFRVTLLSGSDTPEIDIYAYGSIVTST